MQCERENDMIKKPLNNLPRLLTAMILAALPLGMTILLSSCGDVFDTHPYDVNVKDCDWSGVKGGKRGNLCDSLIWTEGHYRDIHFDNLKVNGNVIESLADNLLPE